MTMTVPKRGQMVFGVLDYADGSSRSIQIRTGRDGRVFVRDFLEDEQHAADAAALRARGVSTSSSSSNRNLDFADMPKATSECASRSYYLYNWKITSFKWALQSASVPSYLRSRSNGTSVVVTMMKRANTDLITAKNNCKRNDYISASYGYRGYTSRGTNISSGGGCPGGDGYSVVNFGSLPRGVIGMACAYGVSNGVAKEGDVRLATARKWETYYSWCSGETLIEAAMAHEFGHVYGLGHVYGAPLSMNPYIPNCSLAPSTYGLGDMLGFERKY